MRKLILSLLFIPFMLFSQEDSFFFEDYDTEEESSSSTSIQVDGVTKVYGELLPDYDDLQDSDNGIDALVDVNLLLESAFADLSMNVNFQLEDWDNLSDFPLQGNKYNTDMYIDTLFARFYHSKFDVEVGLLKPIWGNADDIHVLDVLTPLDYSDPFSPSYLDRTMAQQMVKVNVPFGDSSLIEFAYLPKFDGDNIPASGIWQPYYLKTMEEQIYQISAKLNPSASEAALRSQASVIADTFSVEESDYWIDSEIAARYSATINSIDIGLTYYWGHLKQPTIDMDALVNEGDLNLIYNRVNTFGFDLATQVGKFNLRGEFAYNLTEDIKGDDPSVVNNSVGYIVGFDINLPFNNLNFLLQGVGSTVINSGEITQMDPQYNEDQYTDIMLMPSISDNYLNETLYLEVSGAYDIFDKDYMIIPKGSYKIIDNFEIFLEYIILGGEKDTDFGQYRDNDTIKLGFEYFF